MSDNLPHSADVIVSSKSIKIPDDDCRRLASDFVDEFIMFQFMIRRWEVAAYYTAPTIIFRFA